MKTRIFAFLVFCSSVHAASVAVDNQVIVRFKKGVDANALFNLLDSETIQKVEPLVPSLNLYLVKTNPGNNSRSDRMIFEMMDEVVYAIPDHNVKLRGAPNDSDFSKQWSLQNDLEHVDIKAVPAWSAGRAGRDASGNEVVIAIVDGGIDVTHQDLRENIWVNAGEIPSNGVDDDGNGFVDDVYGWNAYNDSGTIPANMHGTHVAGIAGARGNNSQQIAGVNWETRLMAVAGSSGSTSVVAKAYGYVIAQKKLWIESRGAKGANIVVTNSSFGVDDADCSSGDYKVWNDLYNAMGELGILSAAATANNNVDVDVKGDVPTSCSSSYLIKVTNTTRKDEKYQSAGYGRRSIEIGAPGTNIYSTVPGNSAKNLTGTSMATPHVAGTVAFLHQVASLRFNQYYLSNPGQGALLVKDAIIKGVDPIASLREITVTGGRLNLYNAAKNILRY